VTDTRINRDLSVTNTPTDEVRFGQEFYRGYRVDVFGVGSAWSFKLSPTKFDLPDLSRSIFFKVANTKPRALSLAKVEINWVLARQKAAISAN
jgi:hypothetical protein